MCFSYIHCSVDLSDGLVVEGELVYLDPVADQLAHDFDLELVQLTLTDGVRFGDHWDDVHLQQRGNAFMYKVAVRRIQRTKYTFNRTYFVIITSWKPLITLCQDIR